MTDLQRIAQIVCNERMVPDARLVAPSPAMALMGLPVRVSAAVPDGYLILMDGYGKVVGICGPEPKRDLTDWTPDPTAGSATIKPETKGKKP